MSDVPDTDGVVSEAGVQGHAISGPSDRSARGERLLAFNLVGEEVSNGLLVLEIPDADLGLGGGAEPVARGREGDLVDGFVASELIHVLTTGEVPEAGGTVLGGGGAEGTIRGDLGVDIEHNSIHGSDSTETAKNEINLFFRKDELFTY